jgi:hypothetical protein
MSQECEGCCHYEDSAMWPTYLCDKCTKDQRKVLTVLWESLMHNREDQSCALFKQAVVNVITEVKQEENVND